MIMKNNFYGKILKLNLIQLCIDLLTEGYSVNVIEIDSVSKKLNALSNHYNGRLRFFKIGTNPKGYKINLQ